ncbi:hypothetical protein TorRG33x02_155830 [Trema orientale]|uniref:Uncharacterized protein n=1 Tax=Trema orientale TaxID=63057 RepID=A0A2P5ET04_TREOI|nr:hypothetical protein TorRG33x02_155830 [Trema orientale]
MVEYSSCYPCPTTTFGSPSLPPSTSYSCHDPPSPLTPPEPPPQRHRFCSRHQLLPWPPPPLALFLGPRATRRRSEPPR